MRTKLFYPAIVLTVFCTLNAMSQTANPVHSSLDEAVVYFRGAELTHSADVRLTKGDNEIVIDGLSSAIDRNSLKIKTTGGAIVSSYEFSVDYLANKNAGPVAKKLTDSIEFYNKKLQQLETDTKINNQLLELLKNGTTKNVSGSEKGLTFDELVKTMDYFKTKSAELEAVSVANQENKTKYEAAVKRLKAQLNEEELKNNKAAGVLKIVLTSPIAVNSKFTISYFTASASWTPFYDINVETTERPIKIVSKAKLSQTTGIEWDKVKLTLSTATPGNGRTAPLFSTWFLDYYAYAVRENAVMTQNAYSYRKASPVMSADVMAAAPEAKLIEESMPHYVYIVNGAEIDRDTYSSLDPSLVASRTFIESEQAKEVWGADVDGAWIVELNTSMDDYVTTSEGAMNITYAIDLPYSIPGNGKEQSLELKTQEVNASYKYYCAPKLDTETYLLAEIANPERLNLLSGKANITYEGTYIGETVVNTSTTQANLTLTLGTDKRVTVKREKMQDFSSTKFIGSETEQTFTYRLTVRNGQNRPIMMTLKDQYPVSTRKEIKVELLDRTTKPTVNLQDLGVLTWEEEIAAGATKTYEISYSVKYPKNRQLNF
ncbi:MAG: DUF4139 domain-containing protein [Tannerella sp.]|nr:DUF4139 domain-containing protein [Tannerella sp.]